jgi:hypothetical protein
MKIKVKKIGTFYTAQRIPIWQRIIIKVLKYFNKY